MVLLRWKKTHNFSLCVNTWLAGCSVSSSWQYSGTVPSTSSPGFYNFFFSSLIRLISFTYDHTWYKNTQTHMFSCLLTLLKTHKPTRWSFSVGRRQRSVAFPSSSRWGAWNSVFSPLPRLRPTFSLRNKSNWWENENHKWFNSAAKSGKIQTPHQPIMDRAASS